MDFNKDDLLNISYVLDYYVNEIHNEEKKDLEENDGLIPYIKLLDKVDKLWEKKASSKNENK